MRKKLVALVVASVALVSGVVVATGVAGATGSPEGTALKAGSPGSSTSSETSSRDLC